ncbi:hypothetical protein RchiOBHm_Chr3g0474601 [Rosa chinensis]|uniref:Uncharacterized protein n=1 Tax=Rosa chinensis TaxID=74649 RepID=A0A2P6RC85_ROSCH|nr:hypothetical protein RchiOBHm_Chr3g0474601 [Rosa chinensis]
MKYKQKMDSLSVADNGSPTIFCQNSKEMNNKIQSSFLMDILLRVIGCQQNPMTW